MPGLEILKPRSVAEAVGMLTDYGDDARPMAGATAVSILLRQGLIAPRYLVSLNSLPGLDAIERRDGTLHLGALVTHREVERSPLVHETVPVLSRTFGQVGNVRVRNVATVGGVLAEADYASDPPCVLLALDAQLEVSGPGGDRSIPAAEFFRGCYETALGTGEILTGVSLKIPPPATRAT
jgi:aerobic carbon-monoxide dehydrogenase medium subunit